MGEDTSMEQTLTSKLQFILTIQFLLSTAYAGTWEFTVGAVTPLIFYPFFPSVSPRADIGKLQLNYINSILGGGKSLP